MKRRRLIGYAAAASATACQAPNFRAHNEGDRLTQPSVRWRMATSWPKSLDIVFGTANTICQRLSTITSGRFTITPYGSGEIAPSLGVLDAVADGTVECGYTAGYYYTDKHPTLSFGTAIPFGFNAQQQSSWLFQGGGLEALRKIYADFNVVNFPAGSTGAQMGGWFMQEIDSVNALKNLRMRIPGLGGDVLQRLGMKTQVLPGGKIFAALEAGEIDAAEWVGPYEDSRLGLNRIAPFYYYPGWWEPGTTYEIQVNQGAWQLLSLEYQEIFQAVVASVSGEMVNKYDAVNSQALKKLVAQGTQLRRYPDSVLRQAQQTAFEMYEDMAADAAFHAMYGNWKDFRRRIYDWNRLNELGFAEFSFNAASGAD
ncbi:MAG: TRAP transporter substrate-binding protein [Elainellaceae cyanobacterium]